MKVSAPNDAWIFYREECETLQDGCCNSYVFLDAYSGYCFCLRVFHDLPSSAELRQMLNEAHDKAKFWPKDFWVLKQEPSVELLRDVCVELKIPLTTLTAKEAKKYVDDFSKGYRQFMGVGILGDGLSERERDEMDAFIPDSYSPCPCASGKKYKYCCQPIFKDVAFAMCAAEERNKQEALHHLRIAESRVGLTAEVLSRYGVCWSYFDRAKADEFWKKALEVNPNHPRTHYVLGLEARLAGRYQEALAHYKKAIESYPPECRYYLNESYNNIGTVYHELGQYKEAKEAWERALVLLPSDTVVKNNLTTFIYRNSSLSPELREVSPFMEKFLNRYR